MCDSGFLSAVAGYMADSGKRNRIVEHATTSGRPVLLRAEGQVGHGQRPVSLTAALAGDCLAFVARETGLTAS